MARSTRIQFPGALYLVQGTAREGAGAFESAEDREAFLDELGHMVQRYGWLCHAYCVLPDGYQVVLETPGANLSRGMRDLIGRFTQSFNRRRGLDGPAFQGRFKAWPVEGGGPFSEVCRAIALAPVWAGLAKKPAKWPWGSYAATIRQGDAPAFLSTGLLMGGFSKKPKKARERYEKFVKAFADKEPPPPRHGAYIGSKAFGEKLREWKGISPAARMVAGRPSLDAIFTPGVIRDHAKRNPAIAKAFLSHGYTLTAIARALGLHCATVSRIVQKMEGLGSQEGAGERGKGGR